MLRRFKKIPTVVAVPMNLETDGIRYQKWGGEQHGKRGDWLVNNLAKGDGVDIYTIDADSFAQTYEPVDPAQPGIYRKSALTYAEIAEQGGKIVTKEGETTFAKGDVLCYNNHDRTDGYAMNMVSFNQLYGAFEQGNLFK